MASRLLEYELWTRIHALNLGGSHGEETRELLAQVSLVELLPEVLERALEPFPARVRTLDALHLATMEHLRRSGHEVVLASYDERLSPAARALGFALYRWTNP